jgi:hypothetical protein
MKRSLLDTVTNLVLFSASAFIAIVIVMPCVFVAILLNASKYDK